MSRWILVLTAAAAAGVIALAISGPDAPAERLSGPAASGGRPGRSAAEASIDAHATSPDADAASGAGATAADAGGLRGRRIAIARERGSRVLGAGLPRNGRLVAALRSSLGGVARDVLVHARIAVDADGAALELRDVDAGHGTSPGPWRAAFAAGRLSLEGPTGLDAEVGAVLREAARTTLAAHAAVAPGAYRVGDVRSIAGTRFLIASVDPDLVLISLADDTDPARDRPIETYPDESGRRDHLVIACDAGGRPTGFVRMVAADGGGGPSAPAFLVRRTAVRCDLDRSDATSPSGGGADSTYASSTRRSP